MRTFPHEFSDMLTPEGLSILKGEARNSLFLNGKTYFALFDGVVDKRKADDSVKLLDTHLYQHLAVEQRKIPPESITGMKENYEETLNKTMHIKTAFFRRSSARSFRAAEKIGLLRMMQSSTFTNFAEAVTGLKLDPNLTVQVSCYEHGDYVGPHNDHHPENEDVKNGFVDFHLMFTNESVAHQYLVYEERGHFSKIVDINIQGGVSVYKLPFWHYTTPLAGKPEQQSTARRWLLLGSFSIVG
ncbi:MAG TPA: hypothetical protein VF290_18190 [Pyrinomonadaceae bacterium]